MLGCIASISVPILYLHFTKTFYRNNKGDKDNSTTFYILLII